MRCPNCGFDNPQGTKFCGQCGIPLELHCANCGFDNPPAFKFCGNCGHALSAPALAHPPKQEPQAVSSAPPPERRQLTVMFCDLVGSTPLSEQLDPEDLREVIHRYREVCERTISRYEGRIAHYIGDGVLVYFGYPQAHEDDEQRAVRAGLGIVEGVRLLNSRLQAEHGVQLAVRLGIHTGLVVVGEMGGETNDLMDIVGENANIAARVQAVAEPNAVVITSATFRLIEGFFDAKPLGAQPLKGISHTVELYQVLHESAARSRLDVEASAGLIPLVGRKQELALLLEGWERVKEGEGHVVLLSGEAGIGKSRLVEALKQQVAADPRAWLSPCQCSPFYQNSALYPIIDLLQRVVLQFDEGDSTEQKLSKLEGFLVQYGFSLPEMTPLFAALLSLPLDGRYPPLDLSPEQQKQKTLQALLTVLLERAAKQPLLFVVEDLHWIDPTTLGFLSLLMAQGPTTRTLAVFTYRPDFTPPWTGRSHVLQLTLSRLTRQQVEGMVHEVTRGKALPGEVLEQIVARTDGVPLFVEELTKTVLESGLLKEGEDSYELAVAPLPPLAIPTTLHDSLMARLDRLATVKEVAQLAATLGREFSYQLLQAIAAVDEETLQRELGRLVAAELLYEHGVPPNATFVFKHALVQEAAYESQLKSKRQQVHQRIAEILVERFPEIAETQPELLAHHFTQAGLKEQAIAYWLKAGERAAQTSANLEAIAHLTQGLALLKTLPDSDERTHQELALQLALTGPLIATKGYGAPETVKAYNRARELGEEVGEISSLFPLLYGEWVIGAVNGRFKTALEVAQQFLHLAEQQDDQVPILIAHRVLGTTLVIMGEFVAGRTHLEKALALYDPRHHRWLAFQYGQDPRAATLSSVAWTLWLLGYPDQAFRMLKEAVALAGDLKHTNTLAYVLFYGGALIGQFSRNTHAVQEYADSEIALAEEKKLSMWLAYATVSKGWTVAQGGAREEGIARMLDGLADLRVTQTKVLTTHLLGLLAEEYGRAGQPREGLNVLDEDQALVEETGERFWEAELQRVKGELLIQSKAEVEAETRFRQAIEIAQHQHAKSLELRATVSLAHLLQKQGKKEEARQILQVIYDWFTEGFEAPDLKEAKALLAELE